MNIILWFLFIEILTFITFPLLFFLLSKFPDRGFTFSKITSLLLLSYLLFLLGSFKILPFTRGNLFFLLFFLLFLSLSLIFKNHSIFSQFIHKNWRLLLGEELLFWLFFLLFLFIRWGNPDLWHPVMGGEKPMDFAFLNSLLRSPYFPPPDPWFAGKNINYYYFGHLTAAVLTKLTALSPSFSYNLMLAFLFAQTAMGAFTLVFTLTRSLFFAFLGSVFLVEIGNLAQVPLILKSFSTSLPINTWYWNATRIMPNHEINEFPFFSFLYADLHSHLFALPLILLILTFCLSLFLHKPLFTLPFFLKLFFLSLFLGILYATNIWDYPSYLLLSLVLFLFSLKIRPVQKPIRKFLFFTFSLVFLSSFLILPFLKNYRTGPLGLNLYQGHITQLSDYLLIHGFFLFILGSFFLSILRERSKLQMKEKAFILILIFFAVFLTVIPDTLDIKVGLGRMNTVFKFYFQAWTLYALASAAALPFVLRTLKSLPRFLHAVWLLFFLLLFFATLTYPPTASFAKIRDRMSPNTPTTLDGMLFMRDSFYFDQEQKLTLAWDYQAINWLNQNIKGRPVILEATTPIYRWGSRVSVYTGLPTVIGWDWHEKAHRSYLKTSEVEERIADVKLIYETTSEEVFFSLVEKYKIDYIYLGQLERAYYDNHGLTKFDTLLEKALKKAYQNQGVTIYEIKKSH